MQIFRRYRTLFPHLSSKKNKFVLRIYEMQNLEYKTKALLKNWK